jgi:hypothetical protein
VKRIDVVLIAIVAIAAGALFYYLARTPVKRAPEPVATATPPPEEWHEPNAVRTTWGQCGLEPGQEDAALREVLASKLTDDALFGGTTVRMEAAQCGAYRQRMAGWPR